MYSTYRISIYWYPSPHYFSIVLKHHVTALRIVAQCLKIVCSDERIVRAIMPKAAYIFHPVAKQLRLCTDLGSKVRRMRRESRKSLVCHDAIDQCYNVGFTQQVWYRKFLNSSS